MAKSTRNVMEDLIGSPKAKPISRDANGKADKAAKAQPAPVVTKGKAQPVKAKTQPVKDKAQPAPVVTKAPRAAATTYTDTMKIKTVKAPLCRVERAQQCWALIVKAKTVGEYRKARAKQLGEDNIGGYLPRWVKLGNIQVLGK